jgi:hypothetical protein
MVGSHNLAGKEILNSIFKWTRMGELRHRRRINHIE